MVKFLRLVLFVLLVFILSYHKVCPVEKYVPRENLHVFGRYCIATIKVGRDKAFSPLFCMVHTLGRFTRPKVGYQL